MCSLASYIQGPENAYLPEGPDRSNLQPAIAVRDALPPTWSLLPDSHDLPPLPPGKQQALCGGRLAPHCPEHNLSHLSGSNGLLVQLLYKKKQRLSRRTRPSSTWVL
jgi:hypothetical protein